MGENTAIEWAHHTFNPWLGCTKVSPACDHCYAEGWAKRTGQAHLWQGERRRTAAANWRQPHTWNRAAAAAGRRDRVFCASLADVFDNQVPTRWRDDLWHLIDQTPHLDWLLLTKRPQNIAKMLPTPAIGAPAWGAGWPNVWLGTTAENQAEADRRVPKLLNAPARIRFLSCEPLLGPVDLGRTCLVPKLSGSHRAGIHIDVLNGRYVESGFPYIGEWDVSGPCPTDVPLLRIDLVIAGGESGPKARPMHPDWARSLRDQCQAAGVAFHFKQWGEWAPSTPEDAYSNPRSGWRCLAGHPHVPRREELYPEAGAAFVAHVGKKAAGRMLDGRTHDDMPCAVDQTT